jgi:hypothetical protein
VVPEPPDPTSGTPVGPPSPEQAVRDPRRRRHAHGDRSDERPVLPVPAGHPRDELEDVSEDLRVTNQELAQRIDQRLKQVEEWAVRFSQHSSQTLAGIIGGVVGGTAGFGITTAVGATLWIAGPAGAFLGVALAVYTWRGREWHAAERNIAIFRMQTDTILAELNRLPRDTLESIRGRLWDRYERVLDAFDNAILPTLRRAA